jgi:two-component system, NtrC family, sensor kinase
MARTAIEYFIPPQLATDTEYYRRIRLIAYILFVTSVFTLFYVGTSLVAGYMKGALIMTVCLLCFIALLFLLRRGMSVLKVANSFGLIGASGIYGCIYFSGGFQSPVLPWLATTPIVILLLAGKKSGFFWVTVCVLMVVFFGIMDYNGYVFPVEYAASKKLFFLLSCHAGLPLIIFLIAMVFENVRIRAHNELSNQKDALQATLSKLTATQAQLIQSEKMASLGELTAGIAHEIQNPINFINNFSEINTELVRELKTAQHQEPRDAAYEAGVFEDIAQNAEKVLHHGRRADAIVKGMLQHTRKSTGQKEPTDLNALAAEFLSLSYHGMQARDKEFHATTETNFDARIGKVAVVPQEIGKVLLNLFNNAFYAVHEQMKKLGDSYEPTVSVSTHKRANAIEICVKDNGMGISKSLQDKIFQPFFTTKPTGEGTGLGLSLGYDIIKAHGGELKVDSKENDGAAFIILLPFGQNV